MLKSYFKIAWRNLSKNRGLFAINVSGLAIGVATCMVIMLFVTDELSFDRHNEKAGQIVRIVLKGSFNGETIKEAVTPAPVAPTLKAELPEVELATRIRNIGSPKITYRNTSYRKSKVALVDPNFFEVFTINFLQGNLKTALAEPNTVVITKEHAARYFGSEDPVNKILEFNNEQYKVTGVIEKVPANSHFHFDVFASLEGSAHAKEQNWMASSYHTYVVLGKGSNIGEFDSKLPAIIEKYMGPQMVQMGMTYEKFKENGNSIGIFAQPLTDVHLYSDFSDATEMEPHGDIKSVYIFSAVALFVLLIACINFMNLSTAGATKRNKEIGVKKILGSHRRQLIFQFMNEAFISCAFAMVMAGGILALTLPWFNELSGKELSAALLLDPRVAGILMFLTFIITLLAGGYPAFFLSSIKPLSAIRNKSVGGVRSQGIRSGLVVFQFAVSSGMVFAMIIVSQQMAFIQDKKIGYDRDQQIVLRESYLLGSQEQAFRDQLLADPRIESVTMSAYVPAGPTDTNMSGVYPGKKREEARRMIVYSIDDKYIPTMGMELVAGRNFSGPKVSDSSYLIINETAAKALGFGNDAIGQEVSGNFGHGNDQYSGTVIGVVKDFHFKSMHEAISPLVMIHNPYGGLIIRVKAKEVAGLIADMETKWKSFETGEPFSYSMLNELFMDTYLKEQKTGTILKVFGLLTIFVACLGLFGLVTFNAEQRFKEIGVRKVLGANVSQIVALLSKDLVVLVAVSFLVAFPVGYYLMDKWLQDFAYRIDIPWWAYVLAGITTLSIAFFTMSFRTIRSAMANPVDSLRSE